MTLKFLTSRSAASASSAKSMLVFAALLLFAAASASAQTNRERRLLLNDYVAPEELISMSKTLPFDKAISLFTDFSKKYLNKIIVDPTNTNKEIGIDIENMYWLQAFENVLRSNSLWYEEREEYFQIYSPEDSAKGLTAKGGGGGGAGGAGAQTQVSKDSLSKILILTRDIKISTVFFEIDVSKNLSTGINWSYLYSDTITSKAASYAGQMASNLANPNQTSNTGTQSGSSGSSTSGSSGGTSTQPQGFLATIMPNIKFSNLTGFVSFLEGNGLGDVISSPEMIVTSGKKGQIQIGEDIFVVTKDIAGNAIQKQVATGVIVMVTPTLYEQNGVRFINLDTHVEKSAQEASGNLSKNVIDTYLLLNDGEETVIGGLYSTNVQTTRAGVPFLKDLPWWVFGLKYIFGSEVKNDIKNELIVLLKAEVVPTIQERLADKMKKNENLIQKTQKEFEEDMAKRKPKPE